MEELTDLLRNDPAWDNVRGFLKHEGLAVDQVVHAGWLEDEHGWQGGAIVDPTKNAVYTFEINDWRTSTAFDKWDEVDNLEDAIATYPAIRVAVAMQTKSRRKQK